MFQFYKVLPNQTLYVKSLNVFCFVMFVGDERASHLKNLEGLVKNHCLLDYHLQTRPEIITRMNHEESAKIAQQENATETDASAPEQSVTTDYAKVRLYNS